MSTRMFLRLIRKAAAKTVRVGLLFGGFAAAAQTSGLLRLQQIQVTPGGAGHFTFHDYGTGATNFVVEFSPDLNANHWQVDSNAVVTLQSDGSYAVQTGGGTGPQVFYRVNGLGGTSGGLVVTFTIPAFQVVEGDTVSTTLVLSQPFQGWIYYTVTGTADAGDFQPLAGSNYVNGTTVTIPVSLIDNNQIGPLKYLTLQLEAGPGYSLGRNRSTMITIGENDAAWHGTFTADNATLGFTLVIDELNGGYQATLKGEGTGFFPTNEIPAAIDYTPDRFSVTAAGAPVAAGATLLNTPASLTLLLSAMNGVTNQSVSGTQVQGTGELIAEYSGQPQLNNTNFGTFLLLKPPVAPSTNHVQLTAVP